MRSSDIIEHEELRQLVLQNEKLSEELCDEFVSKSMDPKLAFRRGVVIGNVALNQGSDIAIVETGRGSYFFILRPTKGIEREANTLDWWLWFIRREAAKTAGKSEPEARTE
jgi:hypothetical protein